MQAVFSRLAERLREKGHQVTKAWAVPNPDPAAGDLDFWLPRLKHKGFLPTLQSTRCAVGALRLLLRELRHFRPDVVNIHFVNAAAAYFLLLRPLLGYRLVLSIHGSDVLRPHPWDAKLLPRLLRKADAITAVSFLAAERIKAFPGVDPARVRVIPNGVNYDFWSAAGRKADVANGSPILLTVGRLHPVKGHDVLLQAFAILRRRNPQARLVIVGDGPSRQELEGLSEQLGLQEVVEFTGELEEASVRQRLAQALLFALPSRSEGLPLALLEAMAAGVPPVAARVGGVPEVLTPGTGLLVPPEDAEALAAALLELIENPQLASELGRQARERARQFSATTAAAAYEELFQELFRPTDDGGLQCSPS